MADQKADRTSDSVGVEKWEVLTEELLHKTAVFDLKSRRCRHPKRGIEGDFYVLESRDWVNVLPVTSSGEVVMVRQWRFGVKEFSWEIPGGIMDAGEDAVAAGLRELEEETGYIAKSARLLGSIRPNPAIQNNTCYFVVAEGVALDAEQNWDEHEEIEVKLFPIDEVYEMALRGEIIHSLVVNALFRYYPEWLKLKARRR